MHWQFKYSLLNIMKIFDFPPGVQIRGPVVAGETEILTPAALEFLAALHREFNPRRLGLLRERAARQELIDKGQLPNYLAETRNVREGHWQVLPVPEDLQDRRVEITGPVERKMVINALNSRANCFMADFEDAHSPTWQGTIEGQINVRDAVRGTIEYVSAEGKRYKPGDHPATLIVRPRGWHLPENHLVIDGEAVSASLFDFGLYFFHNARYRVTHDSGVYLYLPKLEHYLEARLWNDVFFYAQAVLGIPQGTIKATVLIEHILAAFQMEEILYELRHHSAGLNCGRWDYLFSYIKKFASREEFLVPDRAQVTMTVPFMRAYTRSCIGTCHRRGTFAMGGMSAYIPVKADAVENEKALWKVREDKRREAGDGHDGTWVAHPGLVAIAREEFDAVLGEYPNQIHSHREEPPARAEQLLELPKGTITEEGLRTNVRVGIQYLEAWLGGQGCVPLYNLMEDAATAEISRTQVWQWVHHPQAVLEDGRRIELELVREIIGEELERIRSERGKVRFETGRFAEAVRLFDDLIFADTLDEFLTLKAYESLTHRTASIKRPQIDRHLFNGNGKAKSQAQVEEVQPVMRNAKAQKTGLVSASEVHALEQYWRTDPRWRGVTRPYNGEKVLRLRGTLKVEHTLADRMARKFWDLLQGEAYVHALGALTGNQAVQMARAGLKAIYLSGWQVAADNNLASSMYPDQSLYPANSVPTVVRRINKALQRADQVQFMSGEDKIDFWTPVIADAEAGFGGPLNAYELMLEMVEEGAAGVHFEDQLASAKKCGHMGGKVLVPVFEFIHKLTAARLAADVAGVPTVLIARTDAEAAKLLTSDFDERDQPFCTGERTIDGFFRVRAGLDLAVMRAIAYAPYADILWCETSTPDLEFARDFAQRVHAVYPEKLLAYNCSPSFNWKKNLDESTIARFQDELGAMGYKFQFVTLAGFHVLNWSMWELARGYRDRHLAAYTALQEKEFAEEPNGYSAVKHQSFVGAGYFDEITSICGESGTQALVDSTEQQQFNLKI
jgi:malate synthase A